MDEPARKHRIYITVVLFFASLSFGLTSYIMGPALNEFQRRVDADQNQIGLVLGSVGIMYTIGAILNGILYNYVFNRQVYLSVLMASMGLALVLGPHSTKLYQLIMMAVVSGFGSGGYDTANIVWTVELWNDKSPFYLLACQFMYSLGTFLSPLITGFFLSKNITETIDQNNNFTDTILFDLDQVFETANSTTRIIQTKSHIEIPFSIVGGFLFTSAFLFFGLHLYRRYDSSVYTELDSTLVSANDSDNGSGPIIQDGVVSKTHNVLSILIGIFMIGPYIGMEISNFQLVSIYSSKSYQHMDEQDSALTQTIMGGTFALSRGLVLIFSDRVAPSRILPVSYTIVFVANTAVVLCDHYQLSRACFYSAQAMLGIGFSAVMSSTYGYLEQHINITDLVGGLFVCSGGTGIAIYCYLCLILIEQEKLIVCWFNYGTLICISVAYTLFTLLQKYGKNKQNLSRDQSPSIVVPGAATSTVIVTHRPFDCD